MRAEEAGFQAAMASDHFAPFSLRQGKAGFVWSWLGAALARTNLSFGTVNAPGQRYHPAIIAQACGDAGGDVPRPLLGCPRLRPADQRRHHRRSLANRGGARPAPPRVRRRHPAAARRRDRQPPRPDQRRQRRVSTRCPIVRRCFSARPSRRRRQRWPGPGRMV